VESVSKHRGVEMTTETERQATSETARQISRGLVNLFKKYTGRGPSHARTHIHDDVVVTLLSGTMTHAEQTLKEEDREEMVREQRRVFQDAFRKEAIALAEEITGREVAAFLSDHAVDPDYAVEVFVLAPDGEV
jgi:uncharacterized protein YbcI